MAGAAGVALLSTWAALRGASDVDYRTAAVEKGDIAYNVSATGTLNAVVTVQVGSQVSGNIMALYADFNTKVKKGQVVARIDPQIFQARVDQATAALNSASSAVAQARANLQKSLAGVAAANSAVANARAEEMRAQSSLQNARQNLQRISTLAGQGILSRQDLDTANLGGDTAAAGVEAAKAQIQAAIDNVAAAKAQVEVSRTEVTSAQAQVNQAAAALRQSQADLRNTYILAPVDGIVVARQVDVGQTVAASLQAPTLFIIAQDLTKMQVNTNVSEADIGRVREGQEAAFTVDAYPGRAFHGHVASIRKAAINVQNVVTYDVVITVANPDLKLFPGMTANVNILIDRRSGVVKVPNAALRFRPAGEAAPPRPAAKKGARKAQAAAPADGHVLWVLDAETDKPRAVLVHTGLSDGSYTEVVSGGVQPGDRVVTAAYSKDDSASQSAPGGMRGPRF
jgi:HlyD family secretion protein